MVKPSLWRTLAKAAVCKGILSIRAACQAFPISESCYRYKPKLSDGNAIIAHFLIGLTDSQRNWGFKLCFLHLRNVKGFGWKHKRVYRIYCELELNLPIRPKKRLCRDKPDRYNHLHSPTPSVSHVRAPQVKIYFLFCS